MPEPLLLRLARDLEWLGCELEFQGMRHANEGFPESGTAWEDFVRMRQGVLSTIEKLERELKGSIKYNPASLVGVSYPISDALDSLGILIEALEEIRGAAVASVHELPARVRAFPQLVSMYLGILGQKSSGRQPTSPG